MRVDVKRKKAASLIEIIIVLAIVSFTIIASISLVARTRVEIRNNETEDKANEILLKALEALKAPTKVVISSNNLPLQCISGTGSCFPGSNPYRFTLQTVGSVPQSTSYLLEYQPAAQSLPRANGFNFEEVCNSNNPFYIVDGSDFTYCQQVDITRVNTTSEAYIVNTTLIYTVSGESKSTTLTTYRYGGFQIQGQ